MFTRMIATTKMHTGTIERSRVYVSYRHFDRMHNVQNNSVVCMRVQLSNSNTIHSLSCMPSMAFCYACISVCCIISNQKKKTTNSNGKNKSISQLITLNDVKLPKKQNKKNVV